MGSKANFDPLTKVITITEAPDGNGRVSIDVQKDLYSAAKEDWQSDLALNRLRFCFRDSFGGQDIGDNKQAGAYYFLDNLSGWRVKPYEASHELILNGNLFGVDPLSPVLVPTTGTYTVAIRLNTSSLTQSVLSGSGVTEQDKIDITDKVWNYTR